MSAQTTAPAGAQWFALHTLSGQENKVKNLHRALQDGRGAGRLDFRGPPADRGRLGGEERQEVAARSASSIRATSSSRCACSSEDGKLINKPWYFVKEVAGVIGFVGGEHPAPLRQSEIDEIRARIEAANGKEVPKVQYSVGEEVKINDGPFANLNGRIDEIDPDRGKLKISVSIFGRFTPVELEYWQVQRSTE